MNYLSEASSIWCPRQIIVQLATLWFHGTCKGLLDVHVKANYNCLGMYYKLLLRNGLMWLWKLSSTGFWLRGLLLASMKSLSYTLPSQAPRGEARISSRISKASTAATALGRNSARRLTRRDWIREMSWEELTLEY
jgi:hypothetical protein